MLHCCTLLLAQTQNLLHQICSVPVRLEVFTAVLLKIQVFWDVMPWQPLTVTDILEEYSVSEMLVSVYMGLQPR
jgi:hypothetical protein